MEEHGNDLARGKESVSKITKEFILTNRKEKKIKKMQQKHFQFGLKTYAKTFKRGNG